MSRSSVIDPTDQNGPGHLGEPLRGLGARQFIRILKTRRVAVIFTVILVIGGAAVYCIFKERRYEGVAIVDIDPNRSSGASLEDTINEKLGDSEANTKLQTEIQVMQSDGSLLAVAKGLDLVHRAPFSNLPVFLKGNPPKGDQLSAIQRAVLLRKMRADLSIKLSPGTTLVEVHYLSPDSALAAQVANAVVDRFIEQDLTASTSGEARVAAWLSSEMNDLRNQASVAQQKLAVFQKENGVIGADETQNVVVDRLRLLNQQLTNAEADRILKEARYKIAATRDPELLASVSQSTTLQAMRAQQVDLRSQFDQLSSKFGSGYPRVAELRQQLTDLDQEIRQEIGRIEQRFEEEYLSSQSSEASLRSNLSAQEQLAYKLNAGASQFAMLRHDAESSRDLYDALQYKLREAGVTETLKSAQIHIIDSATAPAIPVEPKVVKVMAISTLLSFFVGIAVALLLDALDDTLRTATDLEASTSLAVLTSVPHVRLNWSEEDGGQPSSDLSSEKRADLIVLRDSASLAAEAYRTLRSSVFFSYLDRNIRIVLITSASAEEGKSLTASNYALSVAQSGLRVLLIDADLRRGRVHKTFQISNRQGLMAAITGNLSVSDYPQPIAELPSLRILPTGPQLPYPSETLASNKMKEFIEHCSEHFDLVVIDSAPLLPVSDTMPLSALADAVVLVVRAGHTHRRALLRSIDRLRLARARVAGAVVTDVDLKLEDYYGYAGKYGYGDAYSRQETDA